MKKRSYIIIFLVILIICFAGGGGFYFFAGSSAEIPESRTSPNIVFLLIDTLRADRVGYHGNLNDTTPVLDSYSRKGIRFMNAYSHSSHTKISMASLFTGLIPPSHGLRKAGSVKEIFDESAKLKSDVLSEDAFTLAELLKKNGYTTIGVHCNPHLVERMGFDQGYDEYIYIPNNPRANRLNKLGLKKLGKDPSEPFFLYLHYMDVHAPYKPPPSYKNLFTKGLRKTRPIYINGPYNRRVSENQIQYTKAIYDAQIRYWDHEFKSLIKRLNKSGALDNTLVIIASDHGEEFHEHGGFGHGFTCYEEMLHVPLVMVWPGVIPESLTREDRVRLIDLVPTITRLCGIDAKRTDWQGRDLFACGWEEKDKLFYKDKSNPETLPVYAETYNGRIPRSLRKGDMKLIYNKKRNLYEMYNLEKDPAEQNKLSPKNTARGLQLKKELKMLINLSPATETGPEVELEEDRVKELKSLGYFND
ncbi:MAG: sulfatase [bacterium]